MRIAASFPVLLFAFFIGTSFAADEPNKADDPKPEENWVSLFNGKDLAGWTPKIRYHELGDNYGNTFRVVDGNLSVRYDKEAYEKYDERFGHLFYKDKFSHYR